jgi:von Willebrand factor type A C-terminal domain/von Willebrand factor type A domain
MPFKIEAFQNRYLPPGQTRVDAILQITAPEGEKAKGGGQLVVGFIVDKSGSMSGERIEGVKNAVWRAISMLDESAWFFVVAFDSAAQVVVRECQANEANKKTAWTALSNLAAGGGTAMSTGLSAARQIFARAPDAIRQAVFLTDGKNESEHASSVGDMLKQCEGVFECDCWGVGTDWRVGEVQEIARALIGKASLIPDPAGIDAAFRAAMTKASSKSLRDVRLRLWTPQGADVVFVKQVNPTIEELTDKAKSVSAQVREYMTGAWAAGESRDFHIAVSVLPGNVNDEMLAARPSMAYECFGAGGWASQEDKSTEGRLFANWTGEDSLSSRIDDHVAHYTGQGELANAIRDGLEQREKGNEAAATQLLGKAVKIAHTSRNAEMTQRLAKVVEVVDPANGTIRLKRDVKKAATMDLELESRTTKRIARASVPSSSSAGVPPGSQGGQGAGT